MDRCRDRNRIRFEYFGVVLCHSLKSGVVLWRTGFAGVATNGDMVDERDFGYPSGELQVKLLYSGFSLVVILQGVARCRGASRSHHQGMKQRRGGSSSTRIC